MGTIKIKDLDRKWRVQVSSGTTWRTTIEKFHAERRAAYKIWDDSGCATILRKQSSD
jgi:hypothetical protein